MRNFLKALLDSIETLLTATLMGMGFGFGIEIFHAVWL